METQTRGKGTIDHGFWGSVRTLADTNPTRLSKRSQAVPLQRPIRHLVKHKWSKRLLWAIFHLLTYITTHNVFLDKCSHPRPLVISGDQLVGLLPTWVSSRWQIMVHLNDLLLQSIFYAMRDIITESWWLRDHSRWVFRKNLIEFSIGFDYLLILLYKWLCPYYYTITCPSRTFYNHMTLPYDMVT